MEVIAEKGENEVFEKYDFDTKLGNLGKECFNCKVRLDDPCTGISKELWKEISQGMPGYKGEDDTAIWPIWCLSLAADKRFQKKMKILAEKSNGRPKAAPVKSSRANDGEPTSRPCQ